MQDDLTNFFESDNLSLGDAGMYQVYFWEIEESQRSVLFDKLMSMVSPEKRKRVSKLKFPIDQLLTLCSEALVRFLDCEHHNIYNSDIKFSENEYGKPYLEDYPDFHFNISHTRDALAVAIADNDIGVDIEHIKKADVKIADRFFALPEKEFVMQSADKNKAFYQIWTRKEAYIKYLGRGLSVPLTYFNVLDKEISQKTQTFERRGYILSVCGVSTQEIPLVDVRSPQFGNQFSNFLSTY